MNGSTSSACPSQRIRALVLGRRFRLVMSLAALIATTGLAGSARAAAGTATKVLHYHGYRLVVPAGWPVFHLAGDRTACVRFDRHAVYLGKPSADQRCPASSDLGRTEAVLVEPLKAPAKPASDVTGHTLPLPSNRGAAAGHGTSAHLVDPARGVAVIATWSHHPTVIRRALGVGSLDNLARTSRASRSRPSAGVTKAVARAHSSAAARPAAAGAVYTGLGFDPCATPSPAAMSAWGASPFRAVGVYIGGTNMACSQPNLNLSWVNLETAAGWHLIPIYVSLQAPADECGCASMSSSHASAASQGTAAASDAVAQAQAVGLGPGNPIYDDMEGYNTTTTNTTAVMAFLAAWTAQLHAKGYISGVYSSAASGIGDLAARYGTGFAEPDDIWIARWNGAKNTLDPAVPRADWAAHQRLHQYEGDVNETYGGVQLNIDGDYLDGATAAAGGVAPSVPSVAAAPSLSLTPAADGSLHLTPRWGGAAGVSSWRVLGGSNPGALAPTGAPRRARARKPFVVRSAYSYFQVQALGSAGQVLGTSPAVATPAHVAIFGQSAFVLARGLGGLPVGCFNSAPCRLTTTITAATRRLSTTRPETIPVGGGLAYFKLSGPGYTFLAHAFHNRLPVTVTVRDASGKSATRQLNLVRFTTSGPSPSHQLQPSPAIRFIGATEFVANGWSGGILAACTANTPCLASSVIVAAGKAIARTGVQWLGAKEIGYLHFTLTNAGHRMLMHRRGNQLQANVKITNGAANPGSTTPGGAIAGAAITTASAQITLASFR